MSSRHDVIEQMIAVALDGMSAVAQCENASSDEVMSAYFTMLRRGINVALTLTKDPAATRGALRDSLYTVLADVADPRLH